MKEKYTVIGLMSGSSMDGVDLACCEFWRNGNTWNYQILCGNTIPYSDMWQVRLTQLPKQGIEIFPKTHAFYGRYLGQLVKQFVEENKIEADFVASHGHTIFHQPEAGFTAQIGDGAALSALCGLPVVSDFRSMDLALGGQGAPLVPIGDQLLFPEYDSCLNLGGIANISFMRDGKSSAFDIAPCNMVFNQLAQSLGQPYDDKGRIASSADIHTLLLNDLNNLGYYYKQGAKSLGREWVKEHFWPRVNAYASLSEESIMATLSAHIAGQIARVSREEKLHKILVTGGGAFNDFLIQQIRENTDAQLIIPEPELVQYKEALIFAFLGVLRITNQNNVLSSVTGSQKDHVAGALYGNFQSLI